jgi:lysine/ornithine N-monooxygenase
MLDNQESPSNSLDAHKGDDLKERVERVLRIINPFPEEVSNLDNRSYTVGYMRELASIIKEQFKQLTTTQQALDRAVEALNAIYAGGASGNCIQQNLEMKHIAKAALSSIKE